VASGSSRRVPERARRHVHTPEERVLVTASGRHGRRVVGVGVETSARRPGRFRKAHGLKRPFAIYVGAST
jgi:hypothetical protein